MTALVARSSFDGASSGCAGDRRLFRRLILAFASAICVSSRITVRPVIPYRTPLSGLRFPPSRFVALPASRAFRFASSPLALFPLCGSALAPSIPLHPLLAFPRPFSSRLRRKMTGIRLRMARRSANRAASSRYPPVGWGRFQNPSGRMADFRKGRQKKGLFLPSRDRRIWLGLLMGSGP